MSIYQPIEVFDVINSSDHDQRADSYFSHDLDTNTLPKDAQKRFDDVENYRKKNISKHRSIRGKLLSSLSGGKRDSELDGWAKYMKKLEDYESGLLLKIDIASFIYGCDRSIMRGTSPENVWGAIKRRIAFKKRPLRMSFLVVSQVIFCTIIVLSQNSKITNSTLVMAGLYIMANAASNSLKICRDLIGYIRRGARLIGVVPMATLVVLGFPVTLLMFGVTLTLDMTIGDIFDISYAGMMNQIVHIIVIFTAISVGLRSGNPVNAIQTFAGFQFIDSFDETVINSFDIDYDDAVRELCKRPPKGDSCKILTVRLFVYFTVPILVGIFTYVTYSNNCYILCKGNS